MSLYDSLIAMQAQINDLRAQLNNISRVDRPSIDGDSFVHLTGDETIAGVKTFSSIPVLPASDPTTDNQAVRKAYADGLVSGLILAVKSAKFTGTQATYLSSQGTTAITDLSITHTLAKSTNRLLLLGYVGQASNSTNLANVGIFFTDGTTPILIGASAGNRNAVGAGNRSITGGVGNAFGLTIMAEYAPGDTSSHTYIMYAQNDAKTSETIYINRSDDDPDVAGRDRTASAFILMEVAG